MGEPVAVVTGGCGFVGRHVVAALLERGWAVRVVDPAWRSDAQSRGEHGEALSGFQASILDRKAMAEALAGARWCFHLAAIAHLWQADVTAYERVNHEGTRSVIAAAEAVGTLERLVVTGSEAVYGSRRRRAGDPAITEATPYPDLDDLPGPYTRSKLGGLLAAEAAARAGLPVITVVPTTPLGPGDHNRTPPTQLVSDCLAERLPAYLDCELDCVDVRDVALAHLAAAERGAVGGRYLAAGTGIALGELLALIADAGAVRVPRRRVPPWLAALVARVGETWSNRVSKRPPAASVEGVRLARADLRFDASATRRELDLAPRPLETAVGDAVAWLQEQGAASAAR